MREAQPCPACGMAGAYAGRVENQSYFHPEGIREPAGVFTCGRCRTKLKRVRDNTGGGKFSRIVMVGPGLQGERP